MAEGMGQSRAQNERQTMKPTDEAAKQFQLAAEAQDERIHAGQVAGFGNSLVNPSQE